MFKKKKETACENCFWLAVDVMGFAHISTSDSLFAIFFSILIFTKEVSWAGRYVYQLFGNAPDLI